MDKRSYIISVDGVEFNFTKDYPFIISRHEIKNMDTISFFHYVPKYERDADGLFSFVGKVEEHWFDLRVASKELSLMSNSIVAYTKNYNCPDGSLMVYLQGVEGARLRTRRVLDDYDESPYGKYEIVGKYLYEIWDLSGLWG